MMKNKIIKIIIVTIIIIMTFGCKMCYATGFNYAQYNPYASMGSVPGIFSGLLNVLTVVGVLGVVIGIALIGFNSILGSASEKADMQQKLVGVVIAAGMISGGSIIANWIIAFAKSI